MSKLKMITSAKMCKLLEREGFVAVRQSGSHRFFLCARDGRTATVPIHSKDLDRGLTRGILKDIGMSVDEYNAKA